MDKLSTSDWVAILAALGMVLALLGNIRSWIRISKADVERLVRIEAKLDTIVQSEEKAILRVEDLENKQEHLDRRVTVAEEQAKSAHKRLDRMENIPRQKN